MTCNLLNNESELNAAFDSVSNSQSGDEWAIFGYDGTSSIVKVEAAGNGGLEQLLTSFNSSKTQYGFATVAAGAQRKVVLFHWQGEGVPAALLSTTSSHVEEIRRFVRRVNLTIYARNEEDLEKQVLERHFEKLQDLAPSITPSDSSAGSSAIQPINNTPFIPPTPASVTNQRSGLNQEINLNEREKFWEEMRDEEELRMKEEANKRRQLQAQYAHEQQEMSEKLHKIHLQRMEAQKQQIGKSASFDSSSINAGKMGKLISGLINKIPIAPIPPVARIPLNQQNGGQQEINLEENGKKIDEELNLLNLSSQNGDATNISPPPSEPTNTETYQQIIEEQNIEEENVKNGEKIENLVNEPQKQQLKIKAKALWDYQAEDNTELTFNPDDIISDIQMVHDGWWYGRSPNGACGLFPSNYVQLLQ
uniref:Drebrin-like protein n=1 Tax=Meloidogyne floridensis TaxID=298350 RepID=A0A915NL89_9BILA